MATLPLDTYQLAAWPRFLGRAFQNNGIWTAIITVASIALFLLAAAAFIAPPVLFRRPGGNFSALLSHNVIVPAFGLLALFLPAALPIPPPRPRPLSRPPP